MPSSNAEQRSTSRNEIQSGSVVGDVERFSHTAVDDAGTNSQRPRERHSRSRGNKWRCCHARMIGNTQSLEPQALDVPRKLGPLAPNWRSLHRE
jgi:hypothetical protein